MSLPHGLTVSPAGAKDAVVVSTGEREWCAPAVEPVDTVAYLPHSCDEWIIGAGTTSEVVGRLRQMRDEVDAAIAYLESQAGGRNR